jgi:hypothetical protein
MFDHKAKCSQVLQCSDVILVNLYRFVYDYMFCTTLFNPLNAELNLIL